MPLKSNDARYNIRASYGNGYKVPSLKERFLNYPEHYGSEIYGNEDLKPEISHSFQLSNEFLYKDFAISLGLFYNDITNFIKSVRTNNNKYQYDNIAKSYTSGVEFATSKAFLEYFKIDLNYTYLIAKNKKTHKDLAERAKHQAKFSFESRFKDFSALYMLRYKSDEYVSEDNSIKSPESFVSDIKFMQKFSRLSVYAGVDNIFNDHADPYKADDKRTKEPRYFYLGLDYTF